MIQPREMRSCPDYLRIAADIEHDIRRGRRQPGASLPAERALARSFGVSHMTLRHALAVLAQRGLVDRQHGRGTFVRQPPDARPAAAAIMVLGRAREEAFFLRDPYYGAMLRGVERELRRRGVDLVLRMKHDRTLGEVLDSARVDGLLVTACNTRLKSETRELARRRVPFALLGRSPKDSAVSFVDSDKPAGGRLAAGWLLARGCRRIVFLTLTRHPTVRQRCAGIRAALAAGAPAGAVQALVLLPVEVEAARRGMREVFAHLRPDGIVLQLPEKLARLALEAWRRAAARRGCPPYVVGFGDDGQVLSRSGLPAAYVESPNEEIGRRAAALLLRQIETRTLDVRQEILPVRLVECAPVVAWRTAGQEPVGRGSCPTPAYRRAGARLPHLESRPPPVGARPRRAIPFHSAVAGGSTGLHGNPGVGRMPRRGGHAPRGG